jgi:hypothetical protein
VLRSDEDFGIRYYGAPDGYELETFVGAIRVAGSHLTQRLFGKIFGRIERLG